MERGLSFFEFNYMIMQAYDFMYLNENYGCNMQFGGDDQWSNMPTTGLSVSDFNNGKVSVVELMLKANMVKSKGEGRRLIEQGGVSVGGHCCLTLEMAALLVYNILKAPNGGITIHKEFPRR